ncbi:MAG: FecR domain-containing protein [Saprospiraceae bacterium]|nr:FecR domain-containing protein [Saprospiraceae bacterium]
MEPFDKNIHALLAKYLAGECSPEEEAAVRRWLEASPDHQHQLADLVWLWERAPEGVPPPPRAVDTEAALRQVQARLRGSGWQVWRNQTGPFLLRAAAVFVLALSAVLWWQTRETSAPAQRLAAAEVPLTDTLADGSRVTLERHSGLTLAAGFNRRERRMRLEGQAFFQVAPDTSRPFIVEVQELQVRVVGTAFTVDNQQTPGQVLVTVFEGKVQVRAGQQLLLLSAGEQAVYDQPSKNLTRTAPRQGNPEPSSRMFAFDATPLGQVAERLSVAYGVRIVLKNKNLENCPLTASYNQLPLERVLRLVADSFSLQVEKTADGYMLSGEACEE